MHTTDSATSHLYFKCFHPWQALQLKGYLLRNLSHLFGWLPKPVLPASHVFMLQVSANGRVSETAYQLILQAELQWDHTPGRTAGQRQGPDWNPELRMPHASPVTSGLEEVAWGKAAVYSVLLGCRLSAHSPRSVST